MFSFTLFFCRWCLPNVKAQMSCTQWRSWRRMWSFRTMMWNALWLRREFSLSLANRPSSPTSTRAFRPWYTSHSLFTLAYYAHVHDKPIINCGVIVCRIVFTLWWSLSTVEIWCIKYNKWENLRNPMLCMYSFLKTNTKLLKMNEIRFFFKCYNYTFNSTK